ncbi:3-phosphoshikimate 1-carboxyvinyltransferase [Thermotomaculum hydrothermale]|uniref:3-phosphoshikimate 1-carboxyvinyltransferase n=1 Tax=Thermotomaculum hydrothermale TaxID=981385 RepID=A0A7R6PPX3_9BACT|nr:3-phosphoshikimate 1-carboxyvinyltransferase [Thermotomaculum hydrothermale]BBB33141.1 3-phosphoshikimate 1-carboxyvinyltransferase [Thermotomaculum hydrothermale]
MIKVLPSEISGTIKINPSKSITQRAYAIASLCNEKSVILNPSNSDDSLSSLNIVKGMGSIVERYENSVEIIGLKREVKEKFNCNEAGLCIRMFTPILSLFEKEIEITGKNSLLKRPVGMMVKPLERLGVILETNNGYPPIKIKGKLKGGYTEVDGSITSQFLTGLLIALTQVEENSEIKVKNLTSKPYIDLTLDLLEKTGVTIENRNYETFFIKPKKLKPLNIKVEGDFSSACFMLVSGAIGGKVRVENLNPDSKQADREILNILLQSGCKIKIGENFIETEQSTIRNFEIDVTNCPDIVPSIIPLGAKGEKPSKIYGISRLRFKESNRVEGLIEEFSKIGVKIEADENSMTVYPSNIIGGKADSRNDHRLAMALAVCGLVSKNGVEIENYKCVSKSYPNFFEDLRKLKGKVIIEGGK